MAFFEVRDLSVGYDRPVLKSIGFSTEKGQMIGILGRNGCGKTTLLRGIAGGARRFGGKLLLEGRDCTLSNTRQQALWLSYLPQQTDLPEGILAREVMAMGRYPHGGLFREADGDTTALVEKAARLLGISHLLDRDCAKLSQGQRQLALLARQLVQDTPVMLLDEPNAALDCDNSHTLFSVLKQLTRREQKLILLVLHDPDLALKWCDSLLLVGEGGLLDRLELSQCDPTGVQTALQRLYPGVVLRRDPYNGALRCYMNDKE